MPHDRRSQAEKWREHRAAFELALELGCTPREAQEELNRRAARERHQTGARALAARRHAPLPRPIAEPEEPRPPWWQRD